MTPAKSFTLCRMCTTSRSRSYECASTRSTRRICCDENPGSPSLAAFASLAFENMSSTPAPPGPRPSCCCSRCRYSFCVLRNTTDSLCASVASLVCTLRTTRRSSASPPAPSPARSPSLLSRPSQRLNSRVISLVTTSTTWSSAPPTSSNVGSSALACAELSPRSLSLMAAMSADASSLRSTHAGGSVDDMPAMPPPRAPSDGTPLLLPIAASSRRALAFSRARSSREALYPKPPVSLAWFLNRRNVSVRFREVPRNEGAAVAMIGNARRSGRARPRTDRERLGFARRRLRCPTATRHAPNAPRDAVARREATTR